MLGSHAHPLPFIKAGYLLKLEPKLSPAQLRGSRHGGAGGGGRGVVKGEMEEAEDGGGGDEKRES